MRTLLGHIFAIFTLLFVAAALVFAVYSTVDIASAGTMPPMPSNCTTPSTMNAWYAEVAKQNLQAHRSPADCKAKLEGLGATPGVAGRACS
jgi:hypothetical protein